MRVVACFVLAACGHATAPASPDLAVLGAPGLRAIDPSRLEANTRYLSSDDLAGRAPGSDGGSRAEAYVAEAFAELGLEPAGKRHLFLQDVPLREASLDEAHSSLVIHARGGDIVLAQGREAVLFPNARDANVALEAPLVFVGYGFATAGYDDLAGVDLQGAIAVIFAGAPHSIADKPLGSAAHAVLADVKVRTVALRDHGASAVLVVYDPARAKRMTFASYIPKVLDSSMAWLDHGVVGSLPVLPQALIDEAALDRVLAGTGTTAHAVWSELDRGHVAHVDLKATASLHIASKLHDVTAHNVAGILRGSDRALDGETVVYTAHVDHLGIGPPVDGDTIYNGALDDAIGVAGIIEIARAFAALPQPPRRSILFLVVTGEEKGLLGSDYFAAHPTIPLARLVADINIDGLTPLYEGFDMIGMGAEHSSLAGDVAAAARATNFVVGADPDPDQVYFIRSDQYSFVKRGVPSVFPSVGWRDAHGDTETNKAISDRWDAEHYHLPSDVWRPEYRAAWAAKEAGFDFLLGLSVAMRAERPQWNPGSPFAGMSAAKPDAPSRSTTAP
jgi:hypothetical protein